MQSAQGIFRYFNVEAKNEVRSIENYETFDTDDTAGASENATSAEPAKKVAAARKLNFFKRLVSRKQSAKDGEEMKKNSVRKMIIKHLTFGKRSKSKKYSGTNTVASEEALSSEQPEVKFEEKSSPEEAATDDEVGVEVAELLPAEESVEMEHVEVEHEATMSMDQDDEVDSDSEEDEEFEEITPEKAPFHIESSDYVGLALVGLLVTLLGSPLCRP